MVKSAAQQLRANNYKKSDLQYGLSVGDIIIIIIIWATLVAGGLDIYAAAAAEARGRLDPSWIHTNCWKG
jgi:PIN domain nuclease of toxin-antitoxin system